MQVEVYVHEQSYRVGRRGRQQPSLKRCISQTVWGSSHIGGSSCWLCCALAQRDQTHHPPSTLADIWTLQNVCDRGSTVKAAQTAFCALGISGHYREVAALYHVVDCSDLVLC